MKGRELFDLIEKKIPLHLAIDGDPVGYLGSIDPEDLDIKTVLVLMDYHPDIGSGTLDYSAFDLVVLHHPPLISPVIPAYIIHSNWDLIAGGACDALADCLNIEATDVLDPISGLGKIGTIRDGPIPLSRFARYVMRSLMVDYLRIVNYSKQRLINRVGIVSGFGLNPNLIKVAQSRGLDLYISGDLTHPGAISAKYSDLVLIDATHHATELPGLKRLSEVLSGMGITVSMYDSGVPAGMYSDCYRPVSYRGINSYQAFPILPTLRTL